MIFELRISAHRDSQDDFLLPARRECEASPGAKDIVFARNVVCGQHSGGLRLDDLFFVIIAVIPCKRSATRDSMNHFNN
jgi:hypothetical protein